MSLRILIRPEQIQQWIDQRGGRPARRPGSDTDLRVLFDEDNSQFEALTVDELIELMRFHHLVMLVDEQPGKTDHQFIRHG